MLAKAQNIFLIGIKGVGMANLALILKGMGKNVSGADTEEEFITDKWLVKNDVHVELGFNPLHLPKETDIVVYSAAHGGAENAIVLEAKAKKIRILHQAEFLGELMKQFKTKIAVTGSHGKTTTTAMLAYALIKLGAKPTYLVGSSDFNDYPAGGFGSYHYFITEADEYAVDPPKDKTPKFKFLHPDTILCTNIDFDHPDVYEDFEDAEQHFKGFYKQGKKVIESDKLKVENVKVAPEGTSFEFNGEKFELSLWGEKNAQNAAGVISVLLEMGFEVEQIRKAVKGFTGAKRRFELIFHQKDTYLFDDYGHHPEEIETTISAARKRFPNKRILLVFQPHTYSRTQALLKGFTEALSQADYAFVMPIFSSARENPEEFKVTSHNVAVKENVVAVDSDNELVKVLGSKLKAGDVVFTMGAGDVYKLESVIINLIRKL